MTPNALSASIRAALSHAQEMPRRVEPTPAQLREDAEDALGCVEVVMDTISEVAQQALTERTFLGLVLLRASCDHGRAMLHLLSTNPQDMAASALALHRAQIETFLRAVFFSRIATDDQLQDFLENDKGARQRTANDKWTNIAVPTLAQLVQGQLEEMEGAEPGSHRLASMVANAWDPLCGMVHGGRAVHALYVDGQRQIGCAVPAEVQYQATTNAVAVVNLALASACTLAGWGPLDDNPALTAPGERFGQFMARHNARLRAVGMHALQRNVDR